MNDEQLGKKIHSLEQEITRIKAMLLQDIYNKTIHNSTIKDPVVTGTTTDSSTIVFTGSFDQLVVANAGAGDDVTVTAAGGSGNEVIVLDKGGLELPNPDGDNPTITAAGAGAAAGIVTNKNFTCVNGIFGANTVKIGDQVLSETAGGLIISNTGVPYLFLKDEGQTAPNNAAVLQYLDDNGTATVALSTNAGETWLHTYGPNGHLSLGSKNTGNIYFYADNAQQLNIAAGAINFNAVNVNFANGTTYKVEADGDATFKDVSVTSILSTSDPQHKIVLDASADAMTFYAGDEATDNYLKIYSASDGNWYPAIFGSTSEEGSLGLSTQKWYQLHCNLGYFYSQVNFAGGTTYKVSSTGKATFANLNSVPLYPNVRLGDWSWGSTDEYITETSTVTGQEAFIYLPLKDTCSQIDIDMYMAYTGDLASLTAALEYIIEGGAWTTIDSEFRNTTGVLSLTGVTTGATTDRQFRIKLTTTTINLSAFDVRVYSCILTQ